MRYLLLGTQGCHLCELAEELIAECAADAELFIDKIDIAEHSEWQADFASKIPVLMHPSTNACLCWPFAKTDALTFINQHHD